MSSIQTKTVKGLTWAYAAFGGDKLLSLLTVLVLARLLGPDDFGVIAAAVLIVGLVDALRDLGVKDALTYRGEANPATPDTAFVLTVGLGVLQTVATLLLAPLAHPLSADGRLVLMIQAMAPVFLLNGLANTHDAILVRRLDFRLCYAVDLVAAALRTVIVLGGVVAGFGVWSFAAGMVAGAAARAAGRWIVLPWRPSSGFDRAHARLLLGFGLHVSAVALLSPLLLRVNQLSVLVYLGQTPLALYVVAMRLPEVGLGSIGLVVSRIMFPVFVRLREDGQRLVGHLMATMRRMVMVSLPVGLGLALTAHLLVPLAFGPGWAAAAPVMRLLALSMTLETVPWTFGDAFKAVGRPDLSTRLMLLEAAYTAPSVWLATLVWRDIAATACVLLACRALAVAVRLGVAARVLGFRPALLWTALRGTVLAALALALAVLGWLEAGRDLPEAGRLAGAVLVGAGAYLLALWIAERGELVGVWRTVTAAWKGGGP